MRAGITSHAEHVVTPDLSPPHLSKVVLTTPNMIQLIEMTCLDAVQPHLEEGEVTVGDRIVSGGVHQRFVIRDAG